MLCEAVDADPSTIYARVSPPSPRGKTSHAAQSYFQFCGVRGGHRSEYIDSGLTARRTPVQNLTFGGPNAHKRGGFTLLLFGAFDISARSVLAPAEVAETFKALGSDFVFLLDRWTRARLRERWFSLSSAQSRAGELSLIGEPPSAVRARLRIPCQRQTQSDDPIRRWMG